MISSPGKLLTLLFHGLQQNFINNDCFYLKISPSSGIKIKLFLDLHLSVDCDFLSVAALCDFSYCFQEMGLLRGQTYSSAACLRVNSSSLLLLWPSPLFFFQSSECRHPSFNTDPEAINRNRQGLLSPEWELACKIYFKIVSNLIQLSNALDRKQIQLLVPWLLCLSAVSQHWAWLQHGGSGATSYYSPRVFPMQMLTCFKPVETIKELQNHVTEIACNSPAWKEPGNQTHCPPGQQRPQQADISSTTVVPHQAGGGKGLGLLGWTTRMLSSSLAHGHLLQAWGLPDSSPSTRSWQNLHQETQESCSSVQVRFSTWFSPRPVWGRLALAPNQQWV